MKVKDALALASLLGVTLAAMPSSRGGKYGYVHPSVHHVYRALRKKGFSKSYAAATANKMAGKKKRGGAKKPKQRGKR